MSSLQCPDNYESLKPKIASAAIVGHTTSRASKIWIRVYKKGDWSLVLSKRKISESESDLVLSGKMDGVCYRNHHSFTKETDLTNCFYIEGLEPDSRYYYYLISNDETVGRRIELGSNHDYWFRTLPDQCTSLVFGFYSCHDPFSVKPAYEGAWEKFYEVLQDRASSFVIGGGDQVYCDTNDKSKIQDVWGWLRKNKNQLINEYSDESGKLDEVGLVDYFKRLYRTYYRVYWQFENLKSVYRRFPQYMIWDDHEIMDGWGSLTEKERKDKLSHWFQDDQPEKNLQLVSLMFSAACAVYKEYQHSHNPDTYIDLNNLKESEWDYSFHHGEYAFYMFDVRGHHNCQNDDGSRLLGKRQFERFKDWIESERVKAKRAIFICSPVPFVHWNEGFVNAADLGSHKDDFMDEWGHESNHRERNKVLDLLMKRSQESEIPIVILSGDVHCVSAFQITKNREYPKARIFNITSSAISRKPAPEIATAAMQKTAKIDGYDGGQFEQLYRFAGANNFALIDVAIRDEDLFLKANLYWTKPERDEVTQKTIWLSR